MWAVLVAAGIAHAMFWYGGTASTPWFVSLIWIGSVISLFWLRTRAPAPRDNLTILAAIATAWVAVQLVPLPLAVLEVLSPMRAELTRAVAAVVAGTASAPISVAPAATAETALTLLASFAIFLTIRQLAASCRADDWRLLAPLIVLGVAEALAGFRHLPGPAHGTFVNQNHYGGLLAMLFPVALSWALCSRPLTFVVPSLLIAGVIASTSRGAWAAALVSTVVVSALVPARYEVSRKRHALIAAVALLVVSFASTRMYSAYVVRLEANGRALASPSAVQPTGADSTLERLTTGRWRIWTDSVRLISDYRLTGCGFGTFGNAFMRYQSYDVDSLYLYAHNEYLQGLAEVGGIGFLPGLIFASLLLRHALKSHQAVAAACAAAIVAAMVDGFVDFGVRLPANALLLAWIAGVAARTTAAATLPSIAPLALNAGLVACSFGYAFLGWVPSVTASPPHRRAEALRLEPSSPDRWLDLAEAASDQGDQTTARLAVKQALRLGGNLPPALLRAFDVLSQQSDREAAFEVSRHLLRLTNRHEALLFGAFDDLKLTPPDVLANALPQEDRAIHSYVRYLFESAPPDRARAAWKWLSDNRWDREFTAAECSQLWCQRGLHADALDLWTEFGRRLEPQYRRRNFVFNGTFDRPFVSGPYSWRAAGDSTDRFQLDRRHPRAGISSLRAESTASGPPATLSQTIALPPASYRWSAFIRAERAGTTLLRITISPKEASGAARAFTWTPSAGPAWSPIGGEFKWTADQVNAELRIEVIENTPGRAWLDSLEIIQIITPETNKTLLNP